MMIGNWIKFADELPADWDSVLVYSKVEDRLYMAWYDYVMKCWLSEGHGRVDGVTHWSHVELPSDGVPYEGASES